MGQHIAQEKQWRIENLALFGGVPAFTDPVHVGRPNVGERAALLARIDDLVDRRWLTNNGIFVQQFELELASRLAVRHCIVTCNATVALEIAIEAMGLQGEVIVPSFTFIASVHALRWRGITPVFCDIDPATHHLAPSLLPDLISPRTTAILGVHLWGRACDVDALEQITKERKLKLLFDAAQAFGCTYRGRSVGGFGDAEVFSFHATKVLNSFEGGAVTTNDDALADRIRLMRNFGFVDMDEIVGLGTNGKMTEAAAAMGLTSLESVDGFIATNRSHYAHYAREIASIPGLTLIPYDSSVDSNFHYIVVEVDEQIAEIDRDTLLRVLHAENVLARRYFYPGCHRVEPYRSADPDAGKRLPETEKLCQRVLILPTGADLPSQAVDTICGCVRLAVSNGAEIRRRFGTISG